MCGIAGIVDYNGRTGKTNDVESMLRSISYRGPDESGIYNTQFATLGNVRLSIIDISGGQQPMSDSSGRYWIVLNGEIFNYKELRKTLAYKGIKFKTSSDTEVLVQLFAIYGKDCLNMLNGQFVFAIWDRLEECLFLARDRVGIRPLFYNVSGKVLSFASEIKALFKLENISRELDPHSLSQIYTFWTTITPRTAFKDIYELQPGHYMTFNKGTIRTERYWQMTYDRQNYNLSLTDAVEKFHELFNNAVRIRLRADVEVAAYLSGGIDSSATVAYIKDIEPGVLNTFSIGFNDHDFDESNYQEEAVRYLDTNHRSISCSSEEIAETFPDVIWHSETPVTRTAPAPMMMLSKLVRQNGIKVVITGEGADEMLAGYNIFRESKIRNFWANDPGSSLRPLLLKRIYYNIPHLRNASPNILKMFFGYKLSDVDNPFYSHLLRWNNANHIRKHLRDEIKNHTNGNDIFNDIEKILPDGYFRWDPLEKAQWIEANVFMSGYLLSSQGDRMAMANSVEGRYPFLDYRIIEYCASISPEHKLKGLNEKYLLKSMLKGKIPDSILARPKQPYRAPIGTVFISGKAPDYVKEMLSGNFIKKAALFNPDSVNDLLNKIKKTNSISEVDSMALTAIISTHLVYNQFIEGDNNKYSRRKLNKLSIINDNNIKHI